MRALTTILAGVLFLAACSGAKTKPEELGPPIPTDFQPGPELGPEPAAPADLAGRAWLDEVHARFYPKWSRGFLEQSRTLLPPSHALNDATLAVTFELVLSPSGSLIALNAIKGSGNADFDGAARQVITDSAPFPRPPTELISDDGNFYVTWLFARDARQAAVAGARFDQRRWSAERAVPAMLAAGRWSDALARVREGLGGAGASAEHVSLTRQAATQLVMKTLTATDASPGERTAAVRAAGRAKLTAALPALRGLAAGAADLSVRSAALAALGELRDADSTKLFEDTVALADGERSAAAAQALANLGARDKIWALVEPRLGDAQVAVRLGALETLAAGAPIGAVPALSAILDKGGSIAGKPASRAERAAAAKALGAILAAGGADAARPLQAALTDGDAAVRAAALGALATAGGAGYRSKGAFYKILPLVKERDPQVRAAAVIALAAVYPAGAAGELAPLGRKETQRTVKVALATAHGWLTDAASLKVLLGLTGSTDEAIKHAAIMALSHRGEPEALAALAGQLGHADPAVRVLAVAAQPDASSLAPALGDDSSEVRAAAVTRLIILSSASASLGQVIDLILAAASLEARVTIAGAFLGASAT